MSRRQDEAVSRAECSDDALQDPRSEVQVRLLLASCDLGQ